MSALEPVVPLSLPNPAALEAAGANALIPPVDAVPPIAPVENDTENTAFDETSAHDESVISVAGRKRLTDPNKSEPDQSSDGYLSSPNIADNQSIRELIQSFENYDNSAAVASYDRQLELFTRYGAASASYNETYLIAALRAGENDVYDVFSITHDGLSRREKRALMNQAIDRWLEGTGVFSPVMLRYASSDGFRFTFLSNTERTAASDTSALSSYDRDRIAAYLQEMARLTPSDFVFYDPTGLSELGLEERRDFLRFVDDLFRQNEIDLRAAELRYQVDETGNIDILLDDADAENSLPIDQLRDEINTYYGQLRYMVHQYKAGIVSAALA